jgi:hypothetical protein
LIVDPSGSVITGVVPPVLTLYVPLSSESWPSEAKLAGSSNPPARASAGSAAVDAIAMSSAAQIAFFPRNDLIFPPATTQSAINLQMYDPPQYPSFPTTVNGTDRKFKEIIKYFVKRIKSGQEVS